MKKTRFIALALVVAIMLMGAGYAAWSDQVFLTSTVKTGTFDMEITKATVRTGHRQAANLQQGWHHFDWTKGRVVEWNGNEAIVEFTNLYPGGVVQVDLTMTNNGTIPAKLKSVNVQYLDGNKKLYNSLLAKSTWKADIDGNGYVQNAPGSNWSHVRPVEWLALQDAMDKLVDDTNKENLVIEPNGFFALGLDDDDEAGCIQFKLDENAGNELQDKPVRFKITFNWEQWTTNPNSNPYPKYGGDGDNTL